MFFEPSRNKHAGSRKPCVLFLCHLVRAPWGWLA